MSQQLTKQKNSYTLMLGFPNSGKTSLFNALTGSQQKIVNYPGSTVDLALAKLKEQPSRFLIDTPGISSLNSNYINESLSINCLQNLQKALPQANKKPDLVLLVVDATQCQQQLALVKQLKEMNTNIVVALTMMDDAKKQGLDINSDQLASELVCPVIPVSKDNQWHYQRLNLACSFQLLLNKESKSPSLKNLEKNTKAYYQWSEATSKKIYNQKPKIPKLSKKLDQLFLHPFLGPVLFLSTMILLFSSLFLFATPFINLIEMALQWSTDITSNLLPENLFSRFLIEGILGGFGAIIVFLPQIAFLFFGLGLLESSGYLSRAALIIDKPLSKIGLSGRSFIPLLAGSACSIPALLASRNIASKKERLICQWIIPLMQCSARLPVYGLLLTLLFPNNPLKSGIALTGIYLFSFILSGLISFIMDKTTFKHKKEANFFCLELPKWRLPNIKLILNDSLTKSISFVKNAGPLIMIIAMILWVISVFPTEEQSIAIQLGPFIEPLFAPLGLDWRCAVAILLSFAAREVFVSVLAVLFASQGTTLIESLSQATFNQTSLFNTSSILSLMIFYMVALQCGSTVAVASKEMGSKKLAFAQVGFYFILAYFLALVVNIISQ